ncbi:MAG TPA: PD-(D/E)XK motif protein [Solirubrobacterales bacterium]|jgi:hypothetical protein|nr:PD-(D/E)XK motif protein [Solirubrobacterales bacterium]
MSFETLWEALEREAPADGGGREVRRIHPDSPIDLFLGVEIQPFPDGNCRTLELQVAREVVADLSPPKGSRQVRVALRERAGGRSGLLLELENPAASDLFAAVCEDVASTTARNAAESEAVAAFIGRFAKWQRMIQVAPTGLSGERQRGLFGELITLREHLIEARGFDEGVRAWKGPDGAPRDFEVGGVGVEVKTSAANEPQVVTIHGERQLDGAGLDALCLIHHSLEVVRDSGETLPDAVRTLRGLGDGLSEAGTFEDRLMQSGYTDVHEPLYRRTGYVNRRISQFEVADGFPRIVEADLADGVGSVRYALAIAACRDFEQGDDYLSGLLGGVNA